MQDMWKPYHEHSLDMLSLDAKDIALQTAAVLSGTHCDNGNIRFHKFIKGLEEVMIERSIPVRNPTSLL